MVLDSQLACSSGEDYVSALGIPWVPVVPCLGLRPFEISPFLVSKSIGVVPVQVEVFFTTFDNVVGEIIQLKWLFSMYGMYKQ